MPAAYKVLAQTSLSTPITLSLTSGLLTAFTQSAVISTLTVTNTSSLPAIYSIYICRNGTTVASVNNALIYRQAIEAYDIIPLTLGITLGYITGEDTIYIESESTNQITFTAFGGIIT